jgi:hypothetical protein
MARSLITVTEIVRESLAFPNGTLSDAGNGNAFVANVGDTFLQIRSTDVSPREVLIQPSPTLSDDDLNIDPRTV